MDSLVDASKVPCVYKSFSCERYVDQHSLAEHSSRCAHAPCYCYECTPLFEGSVASLVHHLMAPSINHYWHAAVNIKYETRNNRCGYKAGALKEGMKHGYVKDCDLVAIFDADFQPEPDFLSRSVPFLVHNPDIALVQARWKFGMYTKLINWFCSH